MRCLMSPPRKAMSVPARSGTQISASALVREKRGSTWMIVAPRSFAFITQRKPTGCASAKGGAQTGHRAAMSYAGLVGHADHAHAGGEKFFDQIIFFVIQRRAAEVTNRGRMIDCRSVFFTNKRALARFPNSIGYNTHGAIE